MPKKRTKKNSSSKSSPPPRRKRRIALPHDMKVFENFERCAFRIFEVIQDAQKKFPNQVRIFYLSIQGHRNALGGYDSDALELMTNFMLGEMMPYLTELYTPLNGHIINNKGQRNDIPDVLYIRTSPESGNIYDINELAVRSRELEESDRKSVPSAQAVADYLGIPDEPCCLICWTEQDIERAHAVPRSLGGSNDVRNIALLCKYHHSQAPDVAYAEAFWAWIDYAFTRDEVDRKVNLLRYLERGGDFAIDTVGQEVEFMAEVRNELIELYRWSEREFSEISWQVMEEVQRVMDLATGRHFGIPRKVSTTAWAYDVALKRVRIGEAQYSELSNNTDGGHLAGMRQANSNR